MKTNTASAEILLITLLLVPFVYVGIIWNSLPTEIATHYNLSGNADGWMPKETAVLIVAGMSLFLYLLLRFLPNIDPKERLQTANYQKLRFVITLAFAALTGWMWYMADHPTNPKIAVVALMVIMSLMLAGMGNYITTIRPNWVVGIRTPWTLESESVWRKTHQLGGRLMVGGGLLSVMLALVVPMPYMIGVAAGVLLLVTLIPVIYSYIFFQREKANSGQLN